MKCQNCVKQATIHITEVKSYAKYDELHLCEDCAKKYLYAPPAGKNSGGSSGVAEMDSSAKLCSVCGLKFIEFRNNGRLGCAHDYDEFREELNLLLAGIHGETQHIGKSPHRIPKDKSAQSELTALRRKLQLAVQDEAYEAAAKLRDQIRVLEETA